MKTLAGAYLAVRFISSLLHAAKNIETAIITCPIDHDDDDGDGPGRLLLEVPFRKTLKMLLSKNNIFATSMLGRFSGIDAEQEPYAQSCDLFYGDVFTLYIPWDSSPFGRICWVHFFLPSIPDLLQIQEGGCDLSNKKTDRLHVRPPRRIWKNEDVLVCSLRKSYPPGN